MDTRPCQLVSTRKKMEMEILVPEYLFKVPITACSCQCVPLYLDVSLSGGVQKGEIEMTRRQKDRAEIDSVSPEVAICCLTTLLSSSYQINCLATLSPVLKMTNVTPNTIL